LQKFAQVFQTHISRQNLGEILDQSTIAFQKLLKLFHFTESENSLISSHPLERVIEGYHRFSRSFVQILLFGPKSQFFVDLSVMTHHFKLFLGLL